MLKYIIKCTDALKPVLIKIIPIDVKSNKSTNNISLTRYNEKYKTDLSIRVSMNNLSKNEKILNIPLFLIEYIENFII